MSKKKHKNAIYSKPPIFPLLWDKCTRQGQPKTIESTVSLFCISWVGFHAHVGENKIELLARGLALPSHARSHALGYQGRVWPLEGAVIVNF